MLAVLVTPSAIPPRPLFSTIPPTTTLPIAPIPPPPKICNLASPQSFLPPTHDPPALRSSISPATLPGAPRVSVTPLGIKLPKSGVKLPISNPVIESIAPPSPPNAPPTAPPIPPPPGADFCICDIT